MVQQWAEIRKALKPRQFVGNFEPAQALRLEGVRGWHHELRIIECADMKFDHLAQLFAAVSLPG